jgi:hypothetical protein
MREEALLISRQTPFCRDLFCGKKCEHGRFCYHIHEGVDKGKYPGRDNREAKAQKRQASGPREPKEAKFPKFEQGDHQQKAAQVPANVPKPPDQGNADQINDSDLELEEEEGDAKLVASYTPDEDELDHMSNEPLRDNKKFNPDKAVRPPKGGQWEEVQGSRDGRKGNGKGSRKGGGKGSGNGKGQGRGGGK